jgi:Fur family transcriptional regulator, ferric uptake regulator
MQSVHALLEQQLKHAGHSITKQRMLVFDALYGQEPLFMQEIISTLAKTVDRASVYRTIDLFEKLGIVQRLSIGWKYKFELSDTFHEHHHHMTCKACGKLIPLDGDSHIENDIADLARKHSFVITSHQLEITGLCAACQP